LAFLRDGSRAVSELPALHIEGVWEWVRRALSLALVVLESDQLVGVRGRGCEWPKEARRGVGDVASGHVHCEKVVAAPAAKLEEQRLAVGRQLLLVVRQQRARKRLAGVHQMPMPSVDCFGFEKSFFTAPLVGEREYSVYSV
jgi:hypothetical protein